MTNYGNACNVFGTSSVILSSITIQPNAMTLGVTYAFLVKVTSTDGRRDDQVVSVTPIASGSAQLSITSSFTKFNAGSKLVVNGYLSASYAVTSEWSVMDALGVPVPFTALTSTTKSFTAADAMAQITFPLSIDAGMFSGGAVYSFRLTAYPVGNSNLLTFTEIILTANSPPSGGYVSSIPSSGSALVTKFLVSSPGWTADASNFPLSYAFSYRLSAGSSYLALAASSLRAFTTSTLPSGLESALYMITLRGQATDIYFSSGTATHAVAVQLNANTNVSLALSAGLTSAFSSGDINLAFQTVNNVSS